MTLERRIVVLGSRSVGKSSLIQRFTDHHFPEYYDPTIEGTFTTTLTLPTPSPRSYTLEILDTAGVDETSTISSSYVTSVHGYIIVYAITSRASLVTAEVIRDKILNVVGMKPMVLVGNKSDLEGGREVGKEEGRRVAETWKCGWVEASARSGEGVEETFKDVVKEIEGVEAQQTAGGEQETGGCRIM